MSFCITAFTPVKPVQVNNRLVFLSAHSKNAKTIYYTEPFAMETYAHNTTVPKSEIRDKKRKDFLEKVKADYNDDVTPSLISVVYGADDEDTKVRYKREKDNSRVNGWDVKVFKL